MPFGLGLLGAIIGMIQRIIRGGGLNAIKEFWNQQVWLNTTTFVLFMCYNMVQPQFLSPR